MLRLIGRSRVHDSKPRNGMLRSRKKLEETCCSASPPCLAPTCCTRWPRWATAIVWRWWTPTILPRGRRLIHLPGIDVLRALQAVLSVFPIDTFIPEPCAVMQVVGEPEARPPVQAEMNAVLASHGARPAASLDRHAFHAAAEAAYAIVQTGKRRGDILLTKGVVAPEEKA
jgi:L-fucose mutarotase